jgi:hypothetical protein
MADTPDEKGWFDELMAAFGSREDASPKEREMVRAPTPKPPTFVQGDDESRMDYTLRKKREKRAYDKLLRDMDASPEDYMVPAAAAQAEATEEISRFNRRQQLDLAETEQGLLADEGP